MARDARRAWRGERGAALVLAMAAITLLLALGGGLVTLAITETAIAARYRDGMQAFYAADAAAERTIAQLRATADWGPLVGAGAVWQPYAAGWLDGIVGGPVQPWRSWITVSLRDAGSGLVAIRARADGPRGARRVVEATVGRAGTGVRILGWREVR